jgi:hypothetical protein
MRISSLLLPAGLVAAGATFAHLKAGSLVPKGGETLTVGSKVNVTWFQETGHDGLYDIYYTKNGTSWVEFEEGWQAPKTDGVTVTYPWTVPAGAAGTTTKLRICQMAGGHCTNSTYTLVSGAFTVSTSASVNAADALRPGVMRFDAARSTVETSFELAEEGKVLVQAFDAQGREVARILDATYGAGMHRLSLHSKALEGAKGTLAFRLTAGGQVYNEIWNGSK